MFGAVSMLTVHSLGKIQPDFHGCYFFLYFHGKLLYIFGTDYEWKTKKGYGRKHLSMRNQQEEKIKW